MQGLGLGGLVARVPSEQLQVGATPSEQMGPLLARADPSMRVSMSSWWSILAFGQSKLSGFTPRQEGYAGVEHSGGLYTGDEQEATGCA